MKVSPELVGKVVAIQLARPVYMFEYAAHVKWPGVIEGEQAMVHPMMLPPPDPPSGMTHASDASPKVSVSELLLGALVKEVGDTYIEVALYDISRDGQVCNVMLKTVPSALILSIDRMDGFEVPVPDVITRKRAEAPAGKIILGG